MLCYIVLYYNILCHVMLCYVMLYFDFNLHHIDFDSHHPLIRKDAVVRTLFHRAQNICSTDDDRKKEELHITSALKENGYTTAILKRIFRIHRYRSINQGQQLCFPTYGMYKTPFKFRTAYGSISMI